MKDCNQCGKCCTKYGAAGLSASKDDLNRWEAFHPEIFAYVIDNQIWFDPETGEPLSRCPFLEEPKADSNAPKKYTCGIYLNRPEDCRLYPSLVSEMIRDECEMIELKDFNNQKEAQIRLNLIMADSR